MADGWRADGQAKGGKGFHPFRLFVADVFALGDVRGATDKRIDGTWAGQQAEAGWEAPGGEAG